jgi:hypothetical protein
MYGQAYKKTASFFVVKERQRKNLLTFYPKKFIAWGEGWLRGACSSEGCKVVQALLAH